MPLSRIEIEQIGPGRWVAEVEAGGTSARRRQVSASNFDDVMLAVAEAHAELTAPPAPAKAVEEQRPRLTQHGPDGDKPLSADYGTPDDPRLKVLSVRETEAAQSECIAGEVKEYQKAERERHGDVEELPSRGELLMEADRLGVEVDRRWGAARLQEAIDAAKDA